MVEARNVSLRYLAGDFTDIGLKEWVIQKAKRQRKVEGIWAVQDVSFRLEKGDFLGIIGVNGAGKSTLLKSVTGILPPKKGSIITEGNVVALLELGTGFDGDLDLRENILMRGALLGYTQQFIEERTDEILEFAELTDFQWYKYKQLSSGMRSRLAFSICCMVEPDVLILDEVLSVGDGSFREKSGNKMLEVIGSGAITLFVGHSTATMKKLANKLLWLDHGKQIAFAQSREESLELLGLYQKFLQLRSRNSKLLPNIEELRTLEDPSKPQKQTVSMQHHQKVKRQFFAKEKRYKAYLALLGEIVAQPEKLESVHRYFTDHGITHMALYGESTLSQYLIPIFQSWGIELDYLIENYVQFDFCKTILRRDTPVADYPDTPLLLIMDIMSLDAIKEKLSGNTSIPYVGLLDLLHEVEA